MNLRNLEVYADNHSLFFMKLPSLIPLCIVSCILSLTSCAYSAPQKTDFNTVSQQAAIMLQNRHYYKGKFDEAMSQRIFNRFMNTVDGAKIYLTAADVAEFERKYKNNLHKLILQRKSIDVAMEIFSRVRSRSGNRYAEVKKYINTQEFKFDSDRTIIRDRKKINWPKDVAAAQELWRNLAEELMLNEQLRRTTIMRLANEQGKPNPLKNEKTAKERVLLKFKRDYLETKETDREEVANYMISALAAAYCPHTDYFSAREMDQFTDSIRTQLTGVGALLATKDDGSTQITGIVINGPADRQGQLKLNDKVIGVDHKNNGKMVDIMFMPIEKVVELIKGPVNTKVKLKIRPASDPTEVKYIVIKREKIDMKQDHAKAELYEINLKHRKMRLGVITLPSFYANFDTGVPRCSIDVEKLILRLRKEKMEGLLLDLRGNGGGSLEEVRRMTGFFVGYGPVVQIKDAKSRIKTQYSDRKPPIYNGPLVIAIDKTSASASEILAGALQDYNRAVIVGDSSSYGKGTVQQAFDLKPWVPVMKGSERAGFLKPTIQKFYRVAGSSTQLKGVESDIVIPSFYQGLDIGEGFLKYPLKHDEIRAARKFNPLNRNTLFINRLKNLSKQRIAKCPDFTYIKEDRERLLEQIKKNSISLNKEKRQATIQENDQRIKTRNKERIARFAIMQKEDVKNMNVFRLELDDLSNKELFKLDLTDIKDTYMRLAPSDIENLMQTPKWPSQMTPGKRESISILMDLISLSKNEKVATISLQ